MTLIELLVTTALMGLTMAAVGEMVVLNTTASTRLTNSVDGQLGCSRAIKKITEDIRRSIVIGTIDGTNSINPFSLGAQTLILQEPTYFADNSASGTHSNLDGFPLVQSASSSFAPAYDTVIYNLVSDSNNPGSYLLQSTRLVPTPLATTNLLPAVSSQVVLTGIVGPIDVNTGLVSPFLYLSRADGSGIPTPSPTLSPLGVSVNFEVQVPVNARGSNIRHAAAHAESYLKTAVNLRATNY